MNDEGKNTHLKIPPENLREKPIIPTGGGESYKRDDYTEHGKRLVKRVSDVSKVILQKKDSSVINDLFVRLETPEDFPIKKAKLNFENLGFDILSYSKTQNTVADAKIKKIEFNKFVKRINDYATKTQNPGKSYFSPLENISDINIKEKIESSIDLEDSEPIEVMVNLYSVLSKREKAAIISDIEKNLFTHGIRSEKYTFQNDLTVLICNIKSDQISGIFGEYCSVKEVIRNHSAVIEQSIPISSLPNPLDVGLPETSSSVGIIDSGITDKSPVFKNLIKRRIPYLPSPAKLSPNDHGSFVASRCLYGDNLDECLSSHQLKPSCTLIDIPVFGLNHSGLKVPPSEFHLMKAIEDVVIKLYQEVKVFNLSLGFNVPVQPKTYSNLSCLIDYLSKKYQVLFIIAAGNISNQIGVYPIEHFQSDYSKICSPAESLLSLSVGSIAKYESSNSLSRINQLSPFSRRGPGPDNGIKPEVVAHGGNLVHGYTQSPRISTYGVFTDGNTLAVDNGTSFSAPLISQYAIRLFDAYQKASPNLIKALLCHFSEKRLIPDNMELPSENFIGFGEPVVDSSLFNTDHSAAYVYEGDLSITKYQYIKFHIPKSLAEQEGTKLKIKVTLVYDPDVNIDNHVEYSKSRIALTVVKPTIDGYRDINIESSNKYLLPWNPIIHLEKDFSRSYLTGEWELRLRLYTRGSLSEDYKQNYAVVIEIIDTTSSTLVYQDIQKEFGGVYKPILLRLAA
jgi:hypothetical protein